MPKKILLIEYEPRYLDRIRGFLAGRDVELTIARDGEEGLEAFRRSRPELVLISSVLPKLRTPDVIKAIHDLGSSPPILLMMTGYRGKNRQADAFRVGASSILEKPFSEEAFLTEIDLISSGVDPAFRATAAGPLLSTDDIFSEVLMGIDEAPKTPAAPAKPAIDKKLQDTLSGLMPATKREPARAPAPEERHVRTESFPAAPSKADRRVETNVDRMLTQTLSDLNLGKGGERAPARPVSAERDRPTPPRGTLPPLSPVSPLPPPAAVDPVRTSPGLSAAPTRFAAPAGPAAPPSVPAKAPVAAAVPIAAPPSTGSGPSQPSSLSFPRSEGSKVVPLVAGSTFGRYQILDKIASGGMAEVLKAKMRGEEGFEKIVAIKRILPHMADSVDFITMFIDEAKLAAQLTHSNIIHIYELGKVDAYHYIAMEYVEGKDLRSILKMGSERGWPLTPEIALLIASKVANALDYAHRRMGADGRELDLVHRDVSPQNILISFEGDIKLCDFGIAKAATKVSQTQTGALKGKLQYMSPEQAWGKKIDRRTDIYSLGLVLYEMLAGEKLFTGDTDMAILERVRDGLVEPPSSKNQEVGAEVDRIVLRALAKDPAARYQNASEMEKEINAILYSFHPTPGPADLAIYMHRLLEAGPATSDAMLDAAFSSSATPLDTKGTKGTKGKGLVISKQEAPSPALPVAPEPVAPPEPAWAPPPPAKSKAGLFAGIGVAVVVLGIGGYFLATSGKTAAPPTGAPPVPAAATPATIAPDSAGPGTVTTAPERVVDQGAVTEEARRLAALRAEELRKAAATRGDVPPPAKGPAVPSPDVTLNASRPIQPPVKAEAAVPTASAPARPTEAPARPTPETPRIVEAPKPVEAAPAAPAPAAPIPPPSNAPAKVGDLVGPGEGVVEPRLLRLGTFPGLSPQVRQMRRAADGTIGTPIVQALVTENGTVAETRVIRPSGARIIDEAAVAALRTARIEPATKDGVPVKMWKAFAIGVKP